MILLMLLFPEPLLPMSKTFLFFAFLSCSDGADSGEPAATAGAGAMAAGASMSNGKISSEEATDGTRVEDEDGGEGDDEGGGGDGQVGCCCCCCSSSCSRLVRGLVPSTSVGNSRRLASIVA